MRFVAHYSEVALKGNNRPEFVRALRRGIHKALAGVPHSVAYTEGRFIVDTEGDENVIVDRLSRVFGLSWFAPIRVVPAEYTKICDSVIESSVAAQGHSFKIAVRRSDKGYPMGSQELAAKLGAEVVKATGKSVDLTDPELTVHVDIVKGGAFVYSARFRGPGGLPLGTAGRVMHLFSGGIDSPVAAWLLMKRGTHPVYLHFYLAPTPQGAVQSKIIRLVKILSAYEGKSTIVLVPFAEYQLATGDAPGDLEPSLFRRFMRMTAEVLAPRFSAKAVSTGDSLSQAASQTLWNIASFDEGSTLPVLRPLLTYDKDEIITLARRIGTYDSSLEAYKDCCAMITRHPRTRVKGEEVTEYVRRFGLARLVGKSIEKASLVTYNPAGDTLKVSRLPEAMPSHVEEEDRIQSNLAS
ncbi:MAG TPA: tRNA uracil 4-sulfurtransferase ThiI [Nitrososphaerales archaeon]|nr:tRNA uracil 4-sulfurtransferase ThiI [Nitrososphaerales archaeon]